VRRLGASPNPEEKLWSNYTLRPMFSLTNLIVFHTAAFHEETLSLILKVKLGGKS